MKVTKEVREVLKWDFKGLGLFECTFSNDKIEDIRFFKCGSMGQSLFASSGCEAFLKAVHTALGEVFLHIGEQENRLKHGKKNR